ncbi:PEP/pyruvate-binding domain-containing protein [Streptomyces sp. NBC_00212]|uniref:PEP/pyruvate-binding domain-containing protein n=1 Tax=Streptomyces sp. NBC_00212 TaxID=2975684 RepID=UPI00324A4699
MRDIVMLRDLRAGDAVSAGAKAANLGELISAGVPVPDGFCLPTHVYRDTAGPVLAPALDLLAAGLAQGEKEHQLAVHLGELRETVGSVELPEELLAKLREAHRWLCPDGGSVAVRSSGTSEDSAAASFAGQYHTELGVRSFEAVVDAVRKCWASLWEPHAFRYRERQGVAHQDAAMAVVVQAMAPADSAGVMFTRDPHDAPPAAEPVASAGSVVIESSWGIGEAVVSGIVTPDRYRVSRGDHQVESCEVSAKSLMVVPTSGEDRSGGGTAVVDVPEARREAASLTSAQAVELALHGLAIEACFGRPQDVEWVLSDGRISVLQARPLTHREPAPAAPPDVRWESPVYGAWWARISICDSWLPEPLSPLFATTLFPCLVTNWLRNWAGSVADQSDNPLIPRPMAGTINGFGYLRLDYPMNKYPLRTVKLALNCYKFHLGRLERRWRTLILPRHVQRLGAMRRQDPSALSADELLALIDEAQELSGRYWAILGGLAWYWNAGEWLLAQLYPRIIRQLALDGAELPGHGVLLQGYPSKTTETDSALHRLAVSDADEAEQGCRFEELLNRYGHQVYHLDFAEPTPADDPSSFRTTMEAYRDGRAEDPLQRLRALAARRDEARRRIDSALRGSPLKRHTLQALLRWNRRYGQVRDHALFHFTLGWPVIRRGYVELGRRLAAAGALDTAEDVFFLTGDELKAELRAIGRGAKPRTWRETVGERRARREQQRLLSPPAQVPEDVRIYMGKLDVTAVALLGQRPKASTGSGLHGSAVSPGRVTGPARLVTSVRDFASLRNGEVLVAPYITPAWSPLLALAGAVVTDTGGALSHGSIVAREYGIPAVMGTTHATKRIQDGQIVTVDGDRGLVY